MGSAVKQLHIFFFPFPAHGHMIPLIDIARQFAVRGAKSTIIITPINALLWKESVERDKQSGLDIQIQTIPFAGVQVGLPEGCEDQASVPSGDMMMNFFMAVHMLQQPFEQLLEQYRPDCVVGDMFLTWTTDAAKKYGIPRLVFHGGCNLPHCVSENLKHYAPHEKAASDSEIFVVPGLPDKIEMTRTEIPVHRESDDVMSKRMTRMEDDVKNSEVTSYGVLVNSFYEMEPAYVEYYKKEMGRRTWNIGPVSLYNTNKAQRGKKASIDEHLCLSWLDAKEPDSVLYVSFGSIFRVGSTQLLHIAMGLEASKVPFIWVIKTNNGETEPYLPEGFEERVKGKGLIIKDWAPQVLILDHPAVGGFMTHCGWNSTLEGICAGVPLITWPLFAEQFCNEKLVTQVLKIGIPAGNRVWQVAMEPNTVSVTKERIEEVVTDLMSSGTEAKDMRKRAKELGEMAKKAVEKDGSSYNDFTALIEELKVHSRKSE